MKKALSIGYVSLLILLISSFSGCDPNSHGPSDHPCNFPDAYTENDLRSPRSYKIIDKITSINLVDTTVDAIIHRDSVILMDENFDIIPQVYTYWVDNWIFENLEIYKDVPFNDPQALLDLKERTFYLRTSSDDLDTIKIYFQQCLILEVLFNGQSTEQPLNSPHLGSGASFYFKK
ncbi:MAG TPA: hypothetical protein PKL31_03830 [Fulvivirga sp.]|nr:hypothetical protein [Fulvivirga sp.]